MVTFSCRGSTTCLFHEDVLVLQECSTVWYKTYLSCIYSIRTVFTAKNTLTNVPFLHVVYVENECIQLFTTIDDGCYIFLSSFLEMSFLHVLCRRRSNNFTGLNVTL